MSAPYMPLYVADYLGDTQHLSTEEHGAYLLLLMALWRVGGTLPNDDVKLARIVRLSKAKWLRLRPSLIDLFEVGADSISHGRVTSELQKAGEISQKRSAAGKAGAEAKALKSNNPASANATAKVKHSISDHRETGSNEPVNCAPSALGSVENAFQELRAVYPKRQGANPSEPARKKLAALLKSGVDFSEIVLGAKRYAVEQSELGNVGTPLVAQLVTWLNQRRWQDYTGEAAEAVVTRDERIFAPLLSRYREEYGTDPPIRDGGAVLPAEWVQVAREHLQQQASSR